MVLIFHLSMMYSMIIKTELFIFIILLIQMNTKLGEL